VTDPVPDADAAEQQRALDGSDPADAPAVGDAPEADALEQSRSVSPGEGGDAGAERPLEADDADAAEQAAVVPQDEDEGRE
jgi:hypothetical protein